MASPPEIEVSPSELRFRFQIGKNVPAHVVLHNPTSEKHAFKIKTTSPKKYCVRPASGHIEPKGTKQIEVIMQSQKEYPPDANSTRDKFLLITTPVDSADLEIRQEIFDKSINPNVKESRLRVILDVPSPPPTIPEHSDEGEEIGVHREENEVQRLKREKEDLRRKIDKLESRHASMAVNSFTLFHLLLVAILAFLIGHYLAPIKPIAA